MSEHDDELARALGRSMAAIPVDDPNAALARVNERTRIVRRRRIAVRGGAALVAAVIVGAVWWGARPPGSTQIDTVDRPSPVPTASTVALPGPTSSDPAATVATTGPATTTPTSVPAPSATTAAPAGTSAPVGTRAPGTTAPQAPPPGPTQAPTTAPPASGPVTYGGLGGQVTVRVDAGSLVLVSVRPAAGYTVGEQQASPDEVEVRFEGAAGRTRVRVQLEGGELSPEVQEEGPG